MKHLKNRIAVYAIACISLLISVSCDKLSKDADPLAVDLGLKTNDGHPLKWASCNVGAESPTEIGFYFAWGETREKERYEGTNYAFGVPDDHNVEWNGMTKYAKDGLRTLEPQDDAATMVMGSKWRTPTAEEISALFDEKSFSWERVTRKNKSGNEIQGYLVTSKIPGYIGKSIFIPHNGWKIESGRLLTNESSMSLWSSNVSDHILFDSRFGSRTTYERAQTLHISIVRENLEKNVSSCPRHLGFPVRAVTSE